MFIILKLTYNTEWSLDELQPPNAALVARSAARGPQASPELHREPDDNQDLHSEQDVDGVLLVFLDGGEYAQSQAGEHHQESEIYDGVLIYLNCYNFLKVWSH